MNRRIESVVFLVILTVCLLINSCSPARSVVIVVDESIYRGKPFAHLSHNQELSVRKSLASLLTPKCTRAFVNAELRSPLEVITEDGVVFRDSIDLYMESARNLGLVYEETRIHYWEEFSSCRAQAGTVPPERHGVRLTTDGRARIFLHDSAFQGESFIFGRLSLNGALVHEFIHVGGQPPTPGWFFQHDLAGFEYYDQIIEACQ
jgi:hypothetical protein